MLKHITVLLILAAILLPFSGGVTWLQLQKEKVREEVEREIADGDVSDERIVNFSFSKTESGVLLNWHHSREFEYNGQMYDVIASETRGDSVFYQVYWDVEETEINERLAEAEQMSSEQQAKGLNQSIFKNLYYPQARAEWLVHENGLQLFNNFHSFFYSGFLIPPPVPPPQLG